MMSTRKIPHRGHALAGLLLVVASTVLGCSDHDEPADASIPGTTTSPATPGVTGSADASVPAPARPARYAVQSVQFAPEGSQAYVSILRSTGPQEIDYQKALELQGWGDLWVHEGHVYVSSGEGPVITRYEVLDDDSLKERGRISFGDHGVADAAFWANTFVAPDKAYMINSSFEYVIWDPLTMTIGGRLPLPKLDDRGELKLRTGTIDRANVVHQGKLYQPMYWSDDDYVRFSPDSRIHVIDIATDKVEATLEVPCRGLDVGTLDDQGNLWFSTWTSGVLEPLVYKQPPNCVAQVVPSTRAVTAKFTYAQVAEGREGASVRALGGGALVVSIFHNERVNLAGVDDPSELLGTENWRLWRYDLATGKAAPLEGAPDNSGAVYTTSIDGKPFLLIPGLEYEKSSIWTVENGVAIRQFETRGWATRLFKVP